ncbi:hypothetical protein DFH09DRAFT_1121866 [Mycena vulgaris]|nr:hypothetical protein DFH09DRAFT_1121866 [Mycena vulgaris]
MLGLCATRRDPDFYVEDGDCVLRVENTLFKVSGSLFSRNSMVFRNLFLLDGELLLAGTSDQFPIRVRGTAENSRVLCWLLTLSGQQQYREPIVILEQQCHLILERCGCCKSNADCGTDEMSQHCPRARSQSAASTTHPTSPEGLAFIIYAPKLDLLEPSRVNRRLARLGGEFKSGLVVRYY